MTSGGGIGVRNSIIEGTCGLGPQFPGGNVITEKKCGADKVVVDTGLQPLSTATNGIPVHRLAASSPAVGYALSSACAKVDARGVNRPQGAGCDSGAVERQSSDP